MKQNIWVHAGEHQSHGNVGEIKDLCNYEKILYLNRLICILTQIKWDEQQG